MSNERFTFDKADLLAEHSLLDIYRIARLISPNRLNVGVAVSVFIISVCYCLLSRKTPTVVIDLSRQLANDTIGFTASILGFLVAGFTIFVTGKPEVFAIMARHEYKETGVSYLKYNLSIFMLVFIHYLCFTMLCVFIHVFFGANGAAHMFLKLLDLSPERAGDIRFAAASVVFVVFVTWLFYVLMLLKSFIFNVYHSVMTGIALTIQD